MKIRLWPLAFMLASAGMLAAPAQTPAAVAPATPTAGSLAGVWRCGMDAGGNTMTLVLTITAGDGGKTTATLAVPDVPDFSEPMPAQVTFADGGLHLDLEQASYDGKLNAAGDTLDGALNYNGNAMACAFKRDPAVGN